MHNITIALEKSTGAWMYTLDEDPKQAEKISRDCALKYIHLLKEKVCFKLLDNDQYMSYTFLEVG